MRNRTHRAIRGFGAVTALSDADLAIPIETVVAQACNDLLRRAGDFTGWVEIIDTQEPIAVVVFCIEIAGHRGNERAEVKRAGR